MMLTTILSWLGSFLGGPFITGALNAYKAKLAADDSASKIAADLAARELAVQQVELQAQYQLRTAEIGRWYEPDHLMGYVVAVYFAKLLFWDKVLGLGTTDGLGGFAATTANLIVGFYFAKRSFENIARIIKR